MNILFWVVCLIMQKTRQWPFNHGHSIEPSKGRGVDICKNSSHTIYKVTASWRIKSPFTFHMVFSSGKLTRHGYFLEQTYTSLQKPTRQDKKILVLEECWSIWYYAIIYEIGLKNFLICICWTLANKYGYIISSWSKQATAFYRYKLYLSELHTMKLFSLLEWWNNQTRMEETNQQSLTGQWNFPTKFPGCYWQQP